MPSIKQTLQPGNKQWDNIVRLSAFLIFKHSYEQHCHFRHMDLCFKKSDPGEWFGEFAMPLILEQSYDRVEKYTRKLKKPAPASVPEIPQIESSTPDALVSIESRLSEIESNKRKYLIELLSLGILLMQSSKSNMHIHNWILPSPNGKYSGWEM